MLLLLILPWLRTVFNRTEIFVFAQYIDRPANRDNPIQEEEDEIDRAQPTLKDQLYHSAKGRVWRKRTRANGGDKSAIGAKTKIVSGINQVAHTHNPILRVKIKLSLHSIHPVSGHEQPTCTATR